MVQMVLSHADISSPTSPAHLFASPLSNDVIGKVCSHGLLPSDSILAAPSVGQVAMLARRGIAIPATFKEAANLLNAYAKAAWTASRA